MAATAVSLLLSLLAIASNATAKPLLSPQAERLAALRGPYSGHVRPQALAERIEALPYEGTMLIAAGAGGAGPYGRGPAAVVGPAAAAAAGGRSRLTEVAAPSRASLAELSGPQLARLRQLAAEYAAEGQLRAALGYGPGYAGATPRAQQQQLQLQQLQQLLPNGILSERYGPPRGAYAQQQLPDLEDNLVEEEEELDDDDENDDVEEEEEEEEDEVEPDAAEGELGYAELAEALVRALAAELGEEAAAERGGAVGWRPPTERGSWSQALPPSSQQQQISNAIAGEGIGQQPLDEEALGRIVGYLFGPAADGYSNTDGYIGNEVRPRYRRDAQQLQQQQPGYGDGGDGVTADRRLKGAAAVPAATAAQQHARVKRVRREAPPEPLIRVKRINPNEGDESSPAVNPVMSSSAGGGGGGGGGRVTRRERRSAHVEARELRGLVQLAHAGGARLRRLKRAIRAAMK